MKRHVVFVLCSAIVAACAPPAEGEGEVEPVCTDPVDVPCRDDAFQELAMADAANPRVVETTGDDVKDTYVDSTAGGLNGTQGFVYGKFTDDTFEKVDITDDASFESMDWDLSFRRYVIRMNSGSGGPSCVGAVNTGETNLDDVTELDGEPRLEEFFDDSCTMVPDGSGLPSSPAVVLSGYWEYPGCLQMTGNVYVVQLADGRTVKMQVDTYYETNQEACTPANPFPPSAGGHIRFRWSFL